MKFSTKVAVGVGALALASLSAVSAASASTPNGKALNQPFAVGKHAVKTCAAATPGHAACFAQALANSGQSKPAVVVKPVRPEPGRHPERLQAFRLQRQWPHRRDRRRLQRPDGRVRPGHLPLNLRVARLHHGQRLLPQGEPDRQHHQPAVHGCRLGDRDQPRPGHGLSHLPVLPHPAGRGQDAPRSATWARRSTTRPARAAWTRSATATAAATRPRPRPTTTRASPSWPPPVTVATASSRRPRSRTSSASAVPA